MSIFTELRRKYCTKWKHAKNDADRAQIIQELIAEAEANKKELGRKFSVLVGEVTCTKKLEFGGTLLEAVSFLKERPEAMNWDTADIIEAMTQRGIFVRAGTVVENPGKVVRQAKRLLRDREITVKRPDKPLEEFLKDRKEQRLSLFDLVLWEYFRSKKRLERAKAQRKRRKTSTKPVD